MEKTDEEMQRWEPASSGGSLAVYLGRLQEEDPGSSSELRMGSKPTALVCFRDHGMGSRDVGMFNLNWAEDNKKKWVHWERPSGNFGFSQCSRGAFLTRHNRFSRNETPTKAKRRIQGSEALGVTGWGDLWGRWKLIKEETMPRLAWREMETSLSISRHCGNQRL